MASVGAASPAAARVVHRLPGRLRLKLDRRSVPPDALLRIRQDVAALAGVHQCEANPRTGSLLVLYDEAGFDQSRLASTVGGFEVNGQRVDDEADLAESYSRLARQVDVRVRLLDRRLRHLTHDLLDLKTLLPLGFAALAVREIMIHSAGLPAIPWYVLLWYAFDSYLRLNATPHGQATSKLMEVVVQAAPAAG